MPDTSAASALWQSPLGSAVRWPPPLPWLGPMNPRRPIPQVRPSRTTSRLLRTRHRHPDRLPGQTTPRFLRTAPPRKSGGGARAKDTSKSLSEKIKAARSGVIVRSSGGGTKETTNPQQPAGSEGLPVVQTATKARADGGSDTKRAISPDTGVTAVSPETHANGQQTRVSRNATAAQLNTPSGPGGDTADLTNQTLANAFTTLSTTTSSAREETATPIAPSTFISVARNLISAAVSPFFAPDPTTIPPESPLVWAVLGWVRRQFAKPFADQTPAAAARLTSQTDALGSVSPLADPMMSPNLLVNPGAEVGDASLSGYSSVTVPGWTVTGIPTVIEYGTPRRRHHRRVARTRPAHQQRQIRPTHERVLDVARPRRYLIGRAERMVFVRNDPPAVAFLQTDGQPQSVVGVGRELLGLSAPQ